MNWKSLESINQWEELYSTQKDYVIFKHSIQCPVSFAAKRRFESEGLELTDEVDVYYLDLINHRDVSNKIAEDLSVIHQSPQVIVVKGGNVVHHASHMSVSADKVRAHI